MKKFGIRKTKMNIFWLLIVGVAIGVILGLRQPIPQTQVPVAESQQQGVQQ